MHAHPMGMEAGVDALKQAAEAWQLDIPPMEYTADHPELKAALDLWGGLRPEQEHLRTDQLKDRPPRCRGAAVPRWAGVQRLGTPPRSSCCGTRRSAVRGERRPPRAPTESGRRPTAGPHSSHSLGFSDNPA